MNRKLGFILVAGFLSVQFLTFLHMAEHAFEKHEHNEETCYICLNCEPAKYDRHNEAIALEVPERSVLMPDLTGLFFDSSQGYGFAFPRGPPIFS